VNEEDKRVDAAHTQWLNDRRRRQIAFLWPSERFLHSTLIKTPNEKKNPPRRMRNAGERFLRKADSSRAINRGIEAHSSGLFTQRDTILMKPINKCPHRIAFN
jgi:hypothetical protein